MLSYQHGYHAGNMADVHKHAALACLLGLMCVRDKPFSYIETHAGRGLYHLDTPEARKTGEAAAGIGRAEAAFDPDHPYRQVLDITRVIHGPTAYPGSPLIAAQTLREDDRLHLAELHPAEHAALSHVMAPFDVRPRHEDGLAMARAVCPPTPRRGVLVVDPSYEVKTDFDKMVPFLQMIHRKWNVGVLFVWFPLLSDGTGGALAKALLAADLPKAHASLVRFGPARPSHRMIGSGLFVANAPWGMAEALADIEATIVRANGQAQG